jgi:hypothetical protein
MIDFEDILRTVAVNTDVQALAPVEKIAAAPDDDIPADINTILAATEKILAVSRGQTEPDERDSLEYRRVMTPPKLFAERIEMDAGKLRRTLMRRLARQKSLRALPVSYFDGYTEGLVVGHELSSPLEEINPLQLVEQARRITAMGPGGLTSEDQITEEAQNIHPASFGFLASIEGPECSSQDTWVYTRAGWVLWPDVKDDAEFACCIDGRLEFHRASRVVREEYSGVMLGVKSQDFDFLVTPNHRMWSRKNASAHSQYRWITAREQFGGNWKYPTCCGAYVGTGGSDSIVLPALEHKGHIVADERAFEIIPFARLTGYWLAEGSIASRSRIRITKSKTYDPEIYAKIAQTVEQLGLKDWEYYIKPGTNHGDIMIRDLQLVEFFGHLGKSGTKYITDFFFDASIEVRRALLDALLETDSRVNETHCLYVSTSKRLALDVQRLMIGLGHPTNFREEPDSRDHVKSTNWCACLLKTKERISRSNPTYDYWVTQPDYRGKVYCATVPGGMLFTRRGRGVGFWSGNSSKIGIDTRLSLGAKIGSDGRIYQKFQNRRTGQSQWVTPDDLSGKVVGLPD